MKWILVSLITICSLEFSQFESHAAKRQNQFSLSSDEWILVAISGDTSWSHLPDRIPFIHFDSDKNRVSGFAGCNRFSGSYMQNGDSIHFLPLASTRMYCQESQPTESALMEALLRADKIVISKISCACLADLQSFFCLRKKSEFKIRAHQFLLHGYSSIR